MSLLRQADLPPYNRPLVLPVVLILSMLIIAGFIMRDAPRRTLLEGTAEGATLVEQAVAAERDARDQLAGSRVSVARGHYVGRAGTVIHRPDGSGYAEVRLDASAGSPAWTPDGGGIHEIPLDSLVVEFTLRPGDHVTIGSGPRRGLVGRVGAPLEFGPEWEHVRRAVTADEWAAAAGRPGATIVVTREAAGRQRRWSVPDEQLEPPPPGCRGCHRGHPCAADPDAATPIDGFALANPD